MMVQWKTLDDRNHELLIGGILQICVVEYPEDLMMEVYGTDPSRPLEKWADSLTLDAAKLEALRWAKEILEQMGKECDDALDSLDEKTPR